MLDFVQKLRDLTHISDIHCELGILFTMSEFSAATDSKEKQEELVDEFGSLHIGNQSDDDSNNEDQDFQDANTDEANVNGPGFDEEGPGYVYEKDLAKAIEAKEEGNNYFRNKDYDEALESYSRAITFCPEDDENKENLATFYGNRSAAYASIEEYDLVIEDCTAALALKPDYVKVIARRMLAHEKLEKYEEALAGESPQLH